MARSSVEEECEAGISIRVKTLRTILSSWCGVMWCDGGEASVLSFCSVHFFLFSSAPLPSLLSFSPSLLLSFSPSLLFSSLLFTLLFSSCFFCCSVANGRVDVGLELEWDQLDWDCESNVWHANGEVNHSPSLSLSLSLYVMSLILSLYLSLHCLSMLSLSLSLSLE